MTTLAKEIEKLKSEKVELQFNLVKARNEKIAVGKIFPENFGKFLIFPVGLEVC